MTSSAEREDRQKYHNPFILQIYNGQSYPIFQLRNCLSLVLHSEDFYLMSRLKNPAAQFKMRKPFSVSWDDATKKGEIRERAGESHDGVVLIESDT